MLSLARKSSRLAALLSVNPELSDAFGIFHPEGIDADLENYLPDFFFSRAQRGSMLASMALM